MAKKPTYEELEPRVQESVQETSEHKQTEKKLRDTKEYLQSVFRVAPIGIGVAINRVFKQVNKRICEMTGYSERELIGRNARILYPSNEDYETVGREKGKQLGIHGTGTVETRWKRKDGFIIEVLLSSTPMDLNDLSKGVTFTALDITERKKVEEALRKSEIKHKVMLKNIPGMVYSAHPDWSAEIISGCEMISGYTADEINSKENKWLSIVHPNDMEQVSKVGAEFIKRSKEFVQTYRIITKNGNIRWIEDRKTSRVSKEGEFIGIDGVVFDITERKRTEATLQLKNLVFESALTANSASDDKGIITHVNQAFIQTWGYKSKNEVAGKPISAFLKFEDEAEKIITSLIETEKWEGEYTALKKDGTTFVAYGLATTIKDKSGKLTGFQSSVLDISKQKRVEAALLESEEKYRSIFENAVEGFFQSTPQGRFISVNPAFARMLGYASPEDLITSISDIAEQYYVNTEDRQHYKQRIEKYGSVKDFEFQVRCKDGSQIWVSNSTRAIYDQNGNISRYEGNLSNITGRKQAEEALRQSEKKYRSMMEAMKDPIYICSPDYRIEYMNPAMIKRIGRDATGEYCYKALHDLDDKCSWCVHHIIQQDECCETDFVSPKGNRSYHVTHSPIVHEDGSISKMTVYRDTTDFKKMETQLRQAQKMEAIGTLAGGIAHDFNNILFPMFGYLEMILQDLPEDNPQRSHLIEVFNGAKRARDLVKQILAFSRQKDHDQKPVKPGLIIKEALHLIYASLPSTIKITQNIQRDCGLIFADSSQIHQIVMNLCTNAFHAMEKKGGKLTVQLKDVELTAEDLKDTAMVPGKHISLTVTDTGPGMEQRVIDRIFDPYFTTKEKGKGTGLGLAVVDGIIKSHGGRIIVYSEPGKGTEFKVHLPVIKPQETAKINEDNLPIQKGKEHILLVDDQELIVDMERKMLERLGYHVTARISSTDALEAFRAQPDKFDIVITDMTMPNMTGDKLAEEMIKIRSDIPVILCTGFSEMISKEKTAALGIKGFLMKPVVIKDLSKTIRDILDHQ